MTSPVDSTTAETIQYTEYGIPIRNLWHMLLYAWDEIPLRNRLVLQSAEHAPSLDALLASVLVHSLQGRLRLGLGRGYVEQHAVLRGLRGRVDFAESIRDRSFERGEAYCDFGSFSIDAPANRMIRSTLARLAQAGRFGPDPARTRELRHSLRRLVRNLDGIRLIDLHPDLIRRQRALERDRDYRFMLAVCALIAERQIPLETEGRAPLRPIDRDALVLHRVYERFIANFYRAHLKGWDVSPQKRLDWHAAESHEHLPAMIPDLVLRDRASRKLIVLETKFTARSLVENRWGRDIHDPSHLYQLYAYLRSQEHLSGQHARAEGILLYPAIGETFSERILLQEHLMRIESIDLAAPWEDIERRLLSLVGSPPQNT